MYDSRMKIVPKVSLNHHRWGKETWKLCVRGYLRQRVLYENPDDVTAGHLEVQKTCQRYYLSGVYRDASRYVRKCTFYF